MAGVVLLLDRRDKKIFLFFCYASQQTCVKVKGSLTLREVLMKRLCILKEVSRLRTRDKSTRSQPGELWICKTDAVIV